MTGLSGLDFAPALEAAAARFCRCGATRRTSCSSPPQRSRPAQHRPCALTETALLSPAGLPNRPWYKHTIYAPGEYTGYAAVVIPGVNEAIDAKGLQPRCAAVDGAGPGA